MKRKTTLVLIVFLTIFTFYNQQGFFLKMSKPEKVNWEAYWVRRSGAIERNNFYYIIRKKIKLPFTPDEANLFISCQSRCLPYINGQPVQKIGLYANPPHQYFDHLQISGQLTKGENIIAVLGYNEGIDTFFGPAKPDGLLLQLEVKNGWRKKIITSDKTWQASKAEMWDFETERMGNQTGFQEIFDATKQPLGWEPAEVIGLTPQKPWEKLVLRPIPYLQETMASIKIFQKGFFSPNPNTPSFNIAKFINDGKKTVSQNLNEAPRPASRDVVSSPLSVELKSTEAEKGIHPRPKMCRGSLRSRINFAC